MADEPKVETQPDAETSRRRSLPGLFGTEAEFLSAIVDLALWLGWWSHHDRPAMRADGRWLTPVQGVPGFPDLVLGSSRRDRSSFAVECKTSRGTLTSAQSKWLTALRRGDGLAFVWRPADWTNGAIEAFLSFETDAEARRFAADRETWWQI